ncbi:adenylosuccinate synthetase [Candidatus Woesearchaeota archaeon]|nr:adenylosuccinate synthetase [Candidatus Woesearchaeota archaeon]
MIDIFTGGQGGDEGKGDAIRYVAGKLGYTVVLKVGGCQAGHSTWYKGRKFGLKTVPCAFAVEGVELRIPSGAYIRTDWFLREVEETGVGGRIKVDPYCAIVTQAHTDEENADNNMKGIGSVGTGVGKCLRDRVERKPNFVFAKDVPELKHFITDVTGEIHGRLKKGEDIGVEGTQGRKLDLLHGEYPYVTSRSVISPQFLAEIGAGPRFVRDVYTVFKPYESRVGPGPLKGELTDEEVLKKYRQLGGEVGTVSKRPRRIGAFDFEAAIRTIMLNSTTRLVLTHMDMLEGFDKDHTKYTGEAKRFLDDFIDHLEGIYGVDGEPYPKLALMKTGPMPEDIIDFDLL